MARPRTPAQPTFLRAARLLDVDKGEYIEPGTLLVDGDRIKEVAPTEVPDDAPLVDVDLKRAIDYGWVDGPRIVPAGHAIAPTGGHLDPTMFQAIGPHVMPLT